MSTDNRPPIIAVDFDDTLVKGAWPGIGETRKHVLEWVLRMQARGAKIILWTNRTDEKLDAAVEWCEQQGIVLAAVNDNLPELIEFFGNNPRKIFANIYLDDRARGLGSFSLAETYLVEARDRGWNLT